MKYPTHESSAEVQAILYTRLKDLGYDVFLEVPEDNCYYNDRFKKGFRKARYDIVIFSRKIPKIVIECKNSNSHKTGLKQVRLYEILSKCIVLLCQNKKQIEETIGRVQYAFPFPKFDFEIEEHWESPHDEHVAKKELGWIV